jgi:rubrerythrin
MGKIEDSFHKAYAEEAKATVRLRIFAQKAQMEGYPQIARLFDVIALSEELHAGRALRLLREIGTTEENLAASFESETKIAGAAYEEFIKLATEEDNKGALTFFSQSRDVEDTHAKLYKEAINHMTEERETEYYVCKVCGYVEDGTLPDECPVCGAKSNMFLKF